MRVIPKLPVRHGGGAEAGGAAAEGLALLAADAKRAADGVDVAELVRLHPVDKHGMHLVVWVPHGKKERNLKLLFSNRRDANTVHLFLPSAAVPGDPSAVALLAGGPVALLGAAGHAALLAGGSVALLGAAGHATLLADGPAALLLAARSGAPPALVAKIRHDSWSMEVKRTPAAQGAEP
jgi:hypothetical protein